MPFHHHRDELHVIALGVDSHVLGNAIWLFTFTDILGGIPRKDRMAHLWQEICIEYRVRETGSQLQSLDLSSILDEPGAPNASYPCLKGKAA